MFHKVRTTLKNIGFARELNSLLKGHALDFEAKIQELRFQIHNQARRDRSGKPNAKIIMKSNSLQRKKNSARLKIFFVGTYYDHEMQGFFQGLEKLGYVETYVNLKGGYGINKPKDKVLSPEEDRYWLNHLYESIKSSHRQHPIDFVIGTFTAPSVDLHTLALIRELGIPIVNIAMDDMLPHHWRRQRGIHMGAFGLAPAVDITLQTSRAMIERYENAGFSAIYFPFASDPEIFKPALKKDIDVLFVGNCYGKREKLIAKCTSAGIDVQAYGAGFPRGHVSGSEVPQLFGRSKIILGSSLVGHSSYLTCLKLRDFDAPMSGALYITSHSAALSENFDIGKEIITYKTVSECITKIRYYLENSNERCSIAERGRARALRDHTWEARLNFLPEALGL